MHMAIPTTTIPKKVSGGEDLVVVRRKDFEAFEKWRAEVRDALGKVARGRREYREGRTVTTASPRAFR